MKDERKAYLHPSSFRLHPFFCAARMAARTSSSFGRKSERGWALLCRTRPSASMTTTERAERPGSHDFAPYISETRRSGSERRRRGSEWCSANFLCDSDESVETPTTSAPDSRYCSQLSRTEH